MPALPKGSLILVTGANGFIASHIVDQCLIAGFKVRGTVRSEEKGKWALDHFTKKYGDESFKLFVVPDMSAPGAFTEAVKGDVAAVIHVASNLSFSPDPQKVIPEVTKGIEQILEDCTSQPSIKHFVYTSSSIAAVTPEPNKKFEITVDTWNTGAVERAWGSSPNPWDVYGASKTQAEQILWKFVKEKKPHFVANAILPNANLGPIIDPKGQTNYSSGGWPIDILNGGHSLDQVPPQYHVDVRDTARLHVAPLLDSSIQNERVFAMADPFNQNLMVDIVQKLRPNHKVSEKVADPGNDLSIIKQKPRTEEILLKNFNQPKLIPLAESVEANIAHLP